MANRIPTHNAPGFSPKERLRRRTEDRVYYDFQRREDPVRRFYMSVEWRKTAKRFLWKYPRCKSCGGYATQVDHILTVREHWNRRFDVTNMQSLCQSCHSRKTALDSMAKPGK